MTKTEETSRTNKFLGNLEKVPASPAILGRLIGLFGDMEADLDEIVHLISQDPVLMLKVLKKANSTFYGNTEKVTDIFEATTSIGLYEIFCIINSILAQQSVQFADSLPEAHLNWFWKHSVTTAVIAETLAEQECSSEPAVKSLAYSAGLFHDIGSLLLASSDQDKYQSLKTSRYANEKCRIDEEEETFGVGHDLIGGQLLISWGFPEKLCSAVCFHHRHIPPKMQLKFSKVHSLLRVANCLSHYMYKPEIGMSFVLDRVDEELSSLQIHPEDFPRLILNSRQVTDKIETLL